jgi:hypothetical protein
MTKINERIIQDGVFTLTVFRATGNPKAPYKEEPPIFAKNLFTNEGMDYLALFQSTTPGSVMNHMAVGTVSTAATLTNVVDSMGEVARVTMATRTAANNILTEVATFGGSLHGITSVSLREVGVVNHASSGPNGELRSRSVFAAVVLANSDQLRIEYATTVGSR